MHLTYSWVVIFLVLSLVNRVFGNSPWSCEVDKQREYTCLVLIIRTILKWSLQLKDHHSPCNLFLLMIFFSSLLLPPPPSLVINDGFFSLCDMNRGSGGILVHVVDGDMVKLVRALVLCHPPAVLPKCSPPHKLKHGVLKKSPFLFFLIWSRKS